MKIIFIITAIVLCGMILVGFMFGIPTNISGFAASLTEIMTGGYKQQGITTLSLSQLQSEPRDFQLIRYINCSFQSNHSPLKSPIMINEVAWMGAETGATHEWIELRNISGDAVNVSGWQLINKNERIHVVFPQQSIFDKKYAVLARGVVNDALKLNTYLTFTGAIRNSDEGLRLFDNNCRLIDEVMANPNWPAGDNRTKQTMERTSNFGWVNSLSAGGTPASENARK